ncbi:hypothetical protein [Pseudomonas cannabina]|uniref:Putative Pyocin/colicin protein n=1 Tax=Pseudomonas cannabina TaxID=86840 RepID=A0A0P9L5N4_PSECA|nr:hypothetical protein [Pseudomonas cannabina]KAA8713083.1 hypothetical protein F4W70_09165 [Pseudomonas cannabina]KPW69583.1 putative Pyocin/colicin protein [Pseudomonas cannabina]RMN34269.1 hypothetical protein ALQ64_03770 [Pseudomonas cannabina]SDR35789.1 hypothetical protein SAMN05216597_3926 [Pseudomonas cannabina]
MATRKKRQTNILHDRTSGTVNISHGSSPKPQNTGFFGSGFTNTGASSRKRRRRRLHARAQQQAAAKAHAEAQALAERQAAKHAAPHARIQAEAAERARAEAEAYARAERSKPHRNFIEKLSDAYPIVQSELASTHAISTELLKSSIQKEVDSGLTPDFKGVSEQQLSDLILNEKATINYLLSGKREQLGIL